MPGARRHAHHPRAARTARRSARRLPRRRQQCLLVADGGRGAARIVLRGRDARGLRAGRARDHSRARVGRERRAHPRPRRGRTGGRRPLHRRLDEHGPGGGARAPSPRPRRLRHLGGAARPSRGRRNRPPLPARALRRGDHRGDPLRPAVGGLGPGREPAPQPEGATGAAPPLGRRVLPIKDNVPTKSFPIVTVALIGINVAVWLFYELPNLDHAVMQLAYQPCEVNNSCRVVGQDWEVTAFTSMFLHGDWLHIGGNMLFLWIFGNNVEDSMGKVRYVVFYLLGGFAATALQTVITLELGTAAEARIPNLRARGGVSAVLGAY